MLPFEDRFTRQRQLPEVGLTGQVQLMRQRVLVSQDAAGLVQTLYLQRAGVNVVASSDAAPAFAHAAAFSFGEARAFAEGAHRALTEVLRALGLPHNTAQPAGVGAPIAAAPGFQSAASPPRGNTP